MATLEERFQAQLQDASFRVADGLFEVEQSHLDAIRTILYTVGVPEAVADKEGVVCYTGIALKPISIKS